MGPQSIHNRMKIDVGIDKSREVLEWLRSEPCRQGLTHAADLALHYLGGCRCREDLQALVLERDHSEIARRCCQATDRRSGSGCRRGREALGDIL